MTKKQSSSELSTLASKYAHMTNAQMRAEISYVGGKVDEGLSKPFFRDVRRLAASVLAQDETKGQGK